MMMGRGYFGIGVYHPKHAENIGTLMRSAYAFGANFAFTIGRRYSRQASDTPNAGLHLPLYHYMTLEDLIDHLPIGCPLIGVELHERASLLNRFVHPERACYLLGAEDHGIPQAILDQCHYAVEIPHAAQCLNVSTAGSIVMYDRRVKRARIARLESATR
jgi:tRNA G18 (ribose-2'-O)-methylase SpoU